MPELHSAIPPLPLLLEDGQHRQQCSSVLALPCLATFQTSQHIVINTLDPAYNQRVCDFKCWTEFRQRGRDQCRNSNNFTTGVKQRQLNPTGHYQVPTQGLLNQFCIIFLPTPGYGFLLSEALEWLALHNGPLMCCRDTGGGGRQKFPIFIPTHPPPPGWTYHQNIPSTWGAFQKQPSRQKNGSQRKDPSKEKGNP